MKWPFPFKRKTGEKLARKGFQIHRSRSVDVTNGSDVTITDNSAFTSVLRWCIRTIGEPPLQVIKNDEAQETDPIAELLKQPNPWMDESSFRACLTASIVMKGTGYVMPIFGTSALPVELWPLMPHDVVLEKDPLTGIPRRWLYKNRPYVLDKIFAVKDSCDPNDMFNGWSGLDSVIAEVATDSEATVYTEAILRNMGIPGLIVSIKGNGDTEYELEPEMAQTIKDWSKKAFSGKARGETVVVTVPIDVNMPQVHPDKMALDIIRKVPERRICSVIGIPPIVAGLGEDPKYDNYRAAREAAYESWAVPMWRTIERGLTKGLERFLNGAELKFDLSNVRALQEDADAIAERWMSLYDGDIATRNEARLAVGLDAITGEDNFASTGSTGRASTLKALRDKKRTGRASSEAS